MNPSSMRLFAAGGLALAFGFASAYYFTSSSKENTLQTPPVPQPTSPQPDTQKRISAIVSQRNAAAKTASSRPRNISSERGIDKFLDLFAEILEKNDVQKAKQIALRIKNTFFIDVNSNKTPLLTLPEFHAAIIGLLNKVDTKASSEARKLLAPYYYSPKKTHPPVWLNQKEISTLVSDSSQVSEGFYYHATKLNGLRGILSSGFLKAQQSAHFGAFVATRPEIIFGPYVLALRRNIETLSPLSTNSPFLTPPWLGFSKSIPVNQDTLAYICVSESVKIPADIDRSLSNPERLSIYCTQLMKNCRNWTKGQDVLVIPHSKVSSIIDKIYQNAAFNMKHWGINSSNDILDKTPQTTPVWSENFFLPSKL